MDRQVKAEKAWLIPYRISEKLSGFSMDTLRPLSRVDVNRLMTQPEPLHRFVDKMSGFFQSAVQRISTDYAGDAARIWAGNHQAQRLSIVSWSSTASVLRSEAWRQHPRAGIQNSICRLLLHRHFGGRTCPPSICPTWSL